MLLRVAFCLLTLLTILSCNTATRKVNLTAGSPKPSQETKPANKPDEQLQNQIEQIASLAKGRVGVAAEVLETGQSISLNPHDHFPMQSVYKLPIAMAVLAQVDNGKLALEQQVRVEKADFVGSGQHSPIRDRNPKGGDLSIRELLRLAVSESDGTASDVLLKLVGVDVVSKYLKELGIDELVVANSEKEFWRDRKLQYQNWASPEGSLQLLRNLHEGRGISKQNQQLLFKFMTETPTGPMRLKGLLPKTAVVAHKTGTSGTSDGITAATNDIGLVSFPNGRTLAIAVFVADSPADLETRERVIAQIAKALWDKWGN